MNKSELINELKRYAVRRIEELTTKNADFAGLASLVAKRFGTAEGNVLSDQDAASHIVTASDQSTYPGKNFDNTLVQDCYDVAMCLLDTAVSTSGNAEDIGIIARYLHPLFSQDDATIGIGWDLEEYADWYFADDVSTADKEKYRDELNADWQPVVEMRTK